MPSNNYILFFFILLFLGVVDNAYGQKKSRSKMALQQKMRHVLPPVAVKQVDFFDKNQVQMGLSDASSMRLEKRIEGHNGFTHWKYQQYYQDIPVFGSAYTLHEKEGFVERASGYYLPLIRPMQTAEISKESATRIAEAAMNGQANSENTSVSSFSERKYNSTPPKLVIIDKAYPKSSEYYALAYQVDVSSTAPIDKQRFLVDAHTGRVLLNLPLLMQHAVPGKGVCKYYGEQDIVIDSISVDSFVLRDLSRGNGNTTYQANQEVWTNTSKYWDLVNENQDEVAIDAHYCTAKFYDYLLETFNWNGLGNKGESMDCVIHGGAYVNASWNGEVARFGDGNCNNGPLTTLEVVAHEFTHGLTDYTSNLIYSGDSGAINESISDIFGKAVEYEFDAANFNWYIGQSFLTTPYDEPFRSFENPHDFEHPKVYRGQYWSEAVHTASSVGNHWFYLLVNGGMGINELDYNYSLEGIGMDKAMQIVFLTQTTALTPNSDYPFYQEMSIAAAAELFGTNSAEVEAVQEAWRAVGSPMEHYSFDAFDMALTVPTTVVNTCLADVYYPLEVTLSNVGGQAYLPSMNGRIGLNDLEFSKVISEEILPGEAITYILDDVVLLDENGTKVYLPYFISDEAEFSTNDNDPLLIINNAYHDKNDLSLYATFVEISTCADEYNIRFSITNESCQAIPMGTAFDLTLVSEEYDFEWRESFHLERDLSFNTSFTHYLDIEIPIDAPIAEALLLAKVEYPEEIADEDNDYNIEIPLLSSIQTDFLETFDNLESPYLLIDGYSSSHAQKEYLGETYFVTSGRVSSPNNLLCPDAADMLPSFLNPTLEICVDVEAMNAPLLGFDVLQFRAETEIDFPELYPNSSILKVSWTVDSALYSELIYNQTEGDLYHYEFPLPSQYHGKVFFEFFNYTGNINSFLYTDYDVILMDNLSIKNDLVATDELEDENRLSVFPNPSSGIFRVQYQNQPSFLSIQNLQGQEVLQVQASVLGTDLSLGHLPDGMYWLTAVYGDGKLMHEELVKVGF